MTFAMSGLLMLADASNLCRAGTLFNDGVRADDLLPSSNDLALTKTEISFGQLSLHWDSCERTW